MPGFCCFNCKYHTPECDTWGKSLLGCITILLFVLAIVELIVFGTFANEFDNGTAKSCCGIISEKSYSDIPGSVCYETEFATSVPRISNVNINGSILCQVNNMICDEYENEFTANLSTLELCIESSNTYQLEDICGVDILFNEATSKKFDSLFWCIPPMIFTIVTECISLCQLIGCFKGSCWCENRYIRVFWKTIEVVSWLLLFVVAKIMVENTAHNGYNSGVGNNEAYDYLESDCGIQNDNGIIWTQFDLDLPRWLETRTLEIINGIGIFLSWVEIVLFCGAKCCRIFESNKDEDTQNHADKSIEMHHTQV